MVEEIHGLQVIFQDTDNLNPAECKALGQVQQILQSILLKEMKEWVRQQ